MNGPGLLPTQDVWGLSGAAVRASVDIGLHHEHKNVDRPSQSAIETDLRRRLFWMYVIHRATLTNSAYSIDRDLSIALGRPPAISDDWITAEVRALMYDL